MDLTQQFPRSPRETVHGVTMVARTTDKARAAAAGTLGEYHYNCGMDQRLFALLGTDAAEFQAAATAGEDDSAVTALVAERLAGRGQHEIAAYNTAQVDTPMPADSPMRPYFEEARAAAAPERTDVNSWTDLIDLEEGREVPRRAAAGVA